MDLSFLKIKKSKIAGNGIFSDKEIEEGQSICFLEGELISLDEVIKRCNDGKEEHSDPRGIDNEEYLDLNDLSRTFNHSYNPNTFVKNKNELIALRKIKKREEITYDYSTTMDDNEEKIKKAGRTLWSCKCNCGASNCREKIDQFKTIPREIQEFYIKNKLMPDFMLKKIQIINKVCS